MWTSSLILKSRLISCSLKSRKLTTSILLILSNRRHSILRGFRFPLSTEIITQNINHLIQLLATQQTTSWNIRVMECRSHQSPLTCDWFFTLFDYNVLSLCKMDCVSSSLSDWDRAGFYLLSLSHCIGNISTWSASLEGKVLEQTLK